MKIGKVGEWVFGQANYGRTLKLGNKLLKPMQIAIINCNKINDVLVNLPTGFGKSMLYQYPASKLINKCIIVFVPLKALLWDSIRQASLFQIQSKQAVGNAIDDYFFQGKLPQILFLTPQRLAKNQNTLKFIETLHQKKQIEKFVIDQAHCISQWGSDFRPDYLQLTKLKEFFPGVNILAMSATIPAEARADLVEKMKLYNCYYFQASYNRPNLFYDVRKCQSENISKEIRNYIKEKQLEEQSGIIYCQTIKMAEKVYTEYKKITQNCELFHSKISEKKRAQTYQKFMSGKKKAIIATICFGMGINKIDIRYVINVGGSMSVQNYYQESGRAGRDGKKAYCLLLSYKNDQYPLCYLTQKSSLKPQQKSLKDYVQTQQCHRKILFQKLGQEFQSKDCHKYCDICLENTGATYQQLDFTKIGIQILTQLSKSRKYFTSNQLTNYLLGKQKKQYAQKIKGIFKKQSKQYVQNFINALISKNLLISIIKYHKRFSTRYYKATTKENIKKINQIKYKIKIKPIQTKSIDKFNKYWDSKDIKQSYKKQQKQQIINQLQLQQGKMIIFDTQHQLFLEQLLQNNDGDYQNQFQSQPKFQSQIQGLNEEIEPILLDYRQQQETRPKINQKQEINKVENEKIVQQKKHAIKRTNFKYDLL